MEVDCYNFLSVLTNDDSSAMVNNAASALFNDTVIGYVLTFRTATAVLITTNTQPYFIPADIVSKYFLSTGDKVCATVSMESTNKYIVTNIVRVNRQTKIPSNYMKHFDDITGVPTVKTIDMNGRKIKLGSTAMITMKQNEFELEKIAETISGDRTAKVTKIALGIQEKQENLNYILSNGCDYVYITKLKRS